ncbi:MAG: hypothetical protein AAFX52_09050 [Pseudomonadota bacterium]
MTLTSTVTFLLGGAMLWFTGNDPGSLVDAAYTVLRDNLQLGQDATWNDIVQTARDNLVELLIAGGATLSSGLAVLWSRIRVIGLSIITLVTGHGSTRTVDISWADNAGTIGSAGMLLWMLSSIAAAAGLMTIFSRGRKAPEPLQLLKTLRGTRQV